MASWTDDFNSVVKRAFGDCVCDMYLGEESGCPAPGCKWIRANREAYETILHMDSIGADEFCGIIAIVALGL